MSSSERDVPKQYTKGQLKLEKILNGLGYQTVLEYEVGQYYLDCMVPELSIGFEYDGPYHLDKKKDAKRDKAIGEAGYKVIRVREKELNEGFILKRINEINEDIS